MSGAKIEHCRCHRSRENIWEGIRDLAASSKAQGQLSTSTELVGLRRTERPGQCRGEGPGEKWNLARPGVGNVPSAEHGAKHVGGSWGQSGGGGEVPCCCQCPLGWQCLGVCPRQAAPYRWCPPGCCTAFSRVLLSPCALPTALVLAASLSCASLPSPLPRDSSQPAALSLHLTARGRSRPPP